MNRIPRLSLACAVLPAFLLLPGCGSFQVAVPKPVKIDVNMKVDVTSRTEGPATAVVTAPGTGTVAAGPAPAGTATNAIPTKAIPGLGIAPDANAARTTPAGAAADLYKLLGEVQGLKDNRLVGENNQGYLEVRQKPDGKLPSGEDYGAYVDRIVAQVNEDRKVLYQARAEKSGDPIETHQAQAAQRRRDAAFSGEWIQDAQGKWAQKK